MVVKRDNPLWFVHVKKKRLQPGLVHVRGAKFTLPPHLVRHYINPTKTQIR